MKSKVKSQNVFKHPCFIVDFFNPFSIVPKLFQNPVSKQQRRCVNKKLKARFKLFSFSWFYVTRTP